MAKNIGDERQPVPKSDQVVDMNDLDREATTAVIAAAMTIPVEFYLLDLRYRPAGRHKAPPSDAPLMVWWGPNDRGYGNSLVDKWLGKYTPEQLAAHPEHYRLGVHMLAIPCEMALRVAVPKPKPRDGWGSW